MKKSSVLLAMVVSPALLFSIAASADVSHRGPSQESSVTETRDSGFNISRLIRSARETNFLQAAISKILVEISRYDIEAETTLPIELGNNLNVGIGYTYKVQAYSQQILRKDGWKLEGNWEIDLNSHFFNRLRPGAEVNFYRLSTSRREAAASQIKTLNEFPENSQDVINKMKDGERVEVIGYLKNYLGVGRNIDPLRAFRVEAGLINEIKFIVDIIKLKNNRALVRMINVREDGTINGNSRINLLSPLRWVSGYLDKRLTRELGDQARVSGNLNLEQLPGGVDSQIAEFEVDLGSPAGSAALNEILTNLKNFDSWKTLLEPDMKTNDVNFDQQQRRNRIVKLQEFFSIAQNSSETPGSGVLRTAEASTQDNYFGYEHRLPFLAVGNTNYSRQGTTSNVTDARSGERSVILSRSSISGDAMMGAGKEIDLKLTLDAAFTVNRDDQTFKPQMLKNFSITHFMYDSQGRERFIDRRFFRPTVNQMQDLVRANLPEELLQKIDLSAWDNASEVNDASLQFAVFYGRNLIGLLRTQTAAQLERACLSTMATLSNEFLRFIMFREGKCQEISRRLLVALNEPRTEKRIEAFNKLRRERDFSLLFPGIASQIVNSSGLPSGGFMNVELVLRDRTGLITPALTGTGDSSIQTELLENYRQLQSALAEDRNNLLEVMRNNL